MNKALSIHGFSLQRSDGLRVIPQCRLNHFEGDPCITFAGSKPAQIPSEIDPADTTVIYE